MACAAAVALAGGVSALSSPSSSLSVPQRPRPAAAPQGSYWCPMHANVRGHAGEHCPICGMTLVPMPARDYTPYWLDFGAALPAPAVRRPTRIRFRVRDPHTGQVVRRFDLMHEKRLHFFVISQALDYFAHVHPRLRPDGVFVQTVDLPRPGAYRLIADFMPTGGAPQLLQQTITTIGFAGSVLPGAAPPVDLAPKVVDGVRITPTIPQPTGGREQLLTFHLADAATGHPITDLEPFLGATGHLLLASADFQSVAHSHPVAALSRAFGPDVVFQAVFPRAGIYKVWAQFQRHGQVLTAAFVVNAQPRDQAFAR